MLLRATIVSALLSLGGGGLVAQAGSGSPFDWNTLVGGALGSSPAALVLAWRLNKADKELSDRAREIRELHAETLSVANRMAPILENASTILKEFGQTVQRDPQRDLLGELQGLRDAVERMSRPGGTSAQ